MDEHTNLPSQQAQEFLVCGQHRADQPHCLSRVGVPVKAVEKVAADRNCSIGKTVPLGSVGLRDQCDDLTGTFGNDCLDLCSLSVREQEPAALGL